VLQVEEEVEDRVRKHGEHIANKSGQKMTRAISLILARVPNIDEKEARQLATEAVARVGLGASNAAMKVLQAARS